MTISKATLEILRKVRTSDVTDALDSLGYHEHLRDGSASAPAVPRHRLCRHRDHRRVQHHQPHHAADELRRVRRPPVQAQPRWHHRIPTRSGPPATSSARPTRSTSSTPSSRRCGLLGSNNVLDAKIKGSVGFIIDGACRDSTECIGQQSPVFCTVRSMRHMAGRLRARLGQQADHLRRRLRAPGRRHHRR